MKKIIIAILLVFCCGVFALTIPKSANALEIADLEDDFQTMSDYTIISSKQISIYLNEPNTDASEYYYYSIDYFNFKITEINYNLNYYDSWHIILVTFSYCYWFTGMDFVYTGLFDYGVGAVWIDTGLTTDIQSFVTSNLPTTLDFSFEVEYSILSLGDTENQIEVYIYSDLYFNGVAIADNFTTDYINVPNNIVTNYDGYMSRSFEFSPTILLYAYLYANDMLIYSYPTYIDENTDFLGFIQNATTGFLETEIFGSISIADILLFIVSIALLIFLLRFFAGG